MYTVTVNGEDIATEPTMVSARITGNKICRERLSPGESITFSVRKGDTTYSPSRVYKKKIGRPNVGLTERAKILKVPIEGCRSEMERVLLMAEFYHESKGTVLR